MIDPKHIEFFNELKELLKKHHANIMWSNDYLIFSFKGNHNGRYYQCAEPLFASEIANTFDGIELVTTERVFK